MNASSVCEGKAVPRFRQRGSLSGFASFASVVITVGLVTRGSAIEVLESQNFVSRRGSDIQREVMASNASLVSLRRRNLEGTLALMDPSPNLGLARAESAAASWGSRAASC